MNIKELNREQLQQVKQFYYTQKQDAKGRGVSWGELINIDEIITDAEIFKEYAATDFCKGDFM